MLLQKVYLPADRARSHVQLAARILETEIAGGRFKRTHGIERRKFPDCHQLSFSQSKTEIIACGSRWQGRS
jgi:hypothetical protein